MQNSIPTNSVKFPTDTKDPVSSQSHVELDVNLRLLVSSPAVSSPGKLAGHHRLNHLQQNHKSQLSVVGGGRRYMNFVIKSTPGLPKYLVET